ncbi:MAG TPA: DNA-directed RNA polymerase subunit alpha C-terminal domain-containing protein, partial [Chlorobiota bacterium]|nr:DNA-directed RNA polymerase subunit alpha C-terminal domain-containing protein [Chlorobiota bacterium]
ARRALENAGITTVSRLADVDEDYLLSLHGFGKASLPVVRQITGKG